MEKNKKTRSKKSSTLLLAGTAAGAVATVAGAAWGMAVIQKRHVIKSAQEYMKEGFAALAVEEVVEPHRYSLTRSPEGCAVALNAYYQAHRPERLEWAAQSCLHAGVVIPESYMGLAAAHELTGHDNDALQILNQALGKFDKSADIYYRIGLILRRNKKDQEALGAYLKAADLSKDNNQLAMEAMEYSMQLQKWQEAKQLAERLKGVETDNPEVKLVLARAFLRGGDKGTADSIVQQARALMEKKPQLKQALEQSYGDVLNGNVPPAGKLADGAPAPGARPEPNRSVASEHGAPVPPPHMGPPAGEPNGAHPKREF